MACLRALEKKKNLFKFSTNMEQTAETARQTTTTQKQGSYSAKTPKRTEFGPAIQTATLTGVTVQTPGNGARDPCVVGAPKNA